MTSSKTNLQLLLDTKKEYSKELVEVLCPHIKHCFVKYFHETKSNNKIHRLILKEFQNVLKTISLWDEEQKFKHYSAIKQNTSYIDKLIKSVFLIKTQILNSFIKEDMSISTIKPLDFIYNCYLECARVLYKRPYLLYDKVSSVDYTKQMIEFDVLIKNSIKENIRKSLPLKELIENMHGGSDHIAEIGQKDGLHSYVKYTDDDVYFNGDEEESDVEDVESNAEGSDVEDVESDAEGSDVEDVESDAEGSDAEDVESDAEGSDVEDVESDAKGSDVEDVESDAKGSDVEDVESDANGSDVEDVENKAEDDVTENDVQSQVEKMENESNSDEITVDDEDINDVEEVIEYKEDDCGNNEVLINEDIDINSINSIDSVVVENIEETKVLDIKGTKDTAELVFEEIIQDEEMKKIEIENEFF